MLLIELELTEVCSCCEAPCSKFYMIEDMDTGEPLLGLDGKVQYLCCECAA
jgi:hypothetical protein